VSTGASKSSLNFSCTYPEIGARTDDPVIRRLTTPPYPFLVFYEITNEEIIIHAIRHGARDPSGMPGNR
jgi:toxin ParE1/3/4